MALSPSTDKNPKFSGSEHEAGLAEAATGSLREDRHKYLDTSLQYLLHNPAHAIYFVLLILGSTSGWSAIRTSKGLSSYTNDASFAVASMATLYFVAYFWHLTMSYCSFLEMSDPESNIGKTQFARGTFLPSISWILVGLALGTLVFISGKVAPTHVIIGLTRISTITLSHAGVFLIFIVWSLIASLRDSEVLTSYVVTDGLALVCWLLAFGMTLIDGLEFIFFAFLALYVWSLIRLRMPNTFDHEFTHIKATYIRDFLKLFSKIYLITTTPIRFVSRTIGEIIYSNANYTDKFTPSVAILIFSISIYYGAISFL